MNEPKKINLGPADIRGISDPPDMGKLRPAEEVARRLVVVSDRGTFLGSADTHIALLYGEKMAGPARDFLAEVIRQSRAEGAAAALEEAATELAKAADRALDGNATGDAFAQGKAKGYDGAAHVLRARIKTISDPPDMG